jgi:dephospho-CoA kinase
MGQADRWIISGGIGSGKSAVRRLLDEHGFFTVDADSVGHEVLTLGGLAYRDVSARWPEVVGEDGEIDRAELGRIVFADKDALRELEGVTHPHIFGIITDRVQGIPDPVAVEVPLLHHGLGDSWLRLIVDCNDSIRVDRLLSKGLSQIVIESRMTTQPSRAAWLAAGDVILPNHADHATLERAVDRLVTTG